MSRGLAVACVLIGVAAACAESQTHSTSTPEAARKPPVDEINADAGNVDRAPPPVAVSTESDLRADLESVAWRIDGVKWECATEADARWLRQDLADTYADRDELTMRLENLEQIRKRDKRGEETRNAEGELARFKAAARRRLRRTTARLEAVAACARDE